MPASYFEPELKSPDERHRDPDPMPALRRADGLARSRARPGLAALTVLGVSHLRPPLLEHLPAPEAETGRRHQAGAESRVVTNNDNDEDDDVNEDEDDEFYDKVGGSDGDDEDDEDDEDNDADDENDEDEDDGGEDDEPESWQVRARNPNARASL